MENKNQIYQREHITVCNLTEITFYLLEVSSKSRPDDMIFKLLSEDDFHK